jgi:RHS repeat-associated protein
LNEVLSFRNYSPFGLELGGSHKNLDYQNGYKFGGKELDNFTGLTDFGRRNFDAPLGRFTSQDRFSEKYYGLSTMGYAAGNPINLVDINGDSLDVYALLKSKSHAAAFALFATSKEGKSWLDKYASKGQEVVYNGKLLYKTDKDGEYHKKGINLHYSIKENNSKGSGTSKEINKNGGLDMDFSISKTGFGTGHMIFDLTEAILHESFIHGEQNTIDFMDNSLDDKSNMGIYKNSGTHAHHYFLSREFGSNRTKSNALWPNQAERVLIRANSILSTGFSNNFIKSTMWSFNGSLISIDSKTGKITKQ